MNETVFLLYLKIVGITTKSMHFVNSKSSILQLISGVQFMEAEEAPFLYTESSGSVSQKCTGASRELFSMIFLSDRFPCTPLQLMESKTSVRVKLALCMIYRIAQITYYKAMTNEMVKMIFF